MRVACHLAALLFSCALAQNAAAQGVLTNGWTYTGTIAPVGDSDSWTFAANAGDAIVIRIGEISQTNSFTPRIRLFNPGAVQQALASGASSAEITVTATNSGIFSVIVDDANGTVATGTYRLTLAKTGGQIMVAPGDEGGPMTNGYACFGNLPIGDLDAWNFNANVGESLVLKVGEVTDVGSFDPWVRLYGPDGTLISSSRSYASAEVTTRATNSGTFLVVIANNPYQSAAGSGTYQLKLAKTGDPIVVAPGDQGGPMTNGYVAFGNMPIGDVDSWNFTASAGDSLVVKVGEVVDALYFDPWVRLYGPDGTLIASKYGYAAAEVTTQATNSGTFLVVVANNPYQSDSGNGSYQLKLAKTGDPIVVAPGDEGGPMTNGYVALGNMPIGDLDTWNFTASAGEALIVKVGEVVDAGYFDPWVRLYGPDGALLASSDGYAAAEVITRATNSGTFLVVVANNPYQSDSGHGTYQLKLAKTGDSIVVASGDEGGPMTNGFVAFGSLPIGDIDAWSLSANSGDSVVVKIGEVNDAGNFDPWVRLYGPDGALISSKYGYAAAEVTARATNSGTFLVVVANNPYQSDSGNGTYQLKLAKTGDPIVVASGDEGGSLTNGITNLGNLPIGDLDAWNFTANAGDSLVVKAGQVTDAGNFDPWVRLYGPDGALLVSTYGYAAAEAATRATNSGTFLVVVANNPYQSDAGNGSYLLTLAKTGSQVVVSPGGDGGSLTGAVNYNANLPIGGVDLWTFTTCAGEPIDVRVDELTQTNNFDPWVRLYGPNGELIASSYGAASGEVSVTATNSGAFLALVSNNPYNSDAGSGTFQLTVNSLSSGLKLCNPLVSGTNVNLSGVGGASNATFVLFTQTNLANPLSDWTPFLTNQFDAFGVFYHTNNFDVTEDQRYFRLLEE